MHGAGRLSANPIEWSNTLNNWYAATILYSTILWGWHFKGLSSQPLSSKYYR